MKAIVSLLAILFCLAVPSNALAQTSRSQVRTPEISGRQVRILKNKPHVFISFVREGKLVPLYEGESDRRVWLRFHNNSRWQVMFCSGPVPKEYGETELTYEIERYRGSGETPGTRSSDACGYLLVNSGEHVLFSVPREHLIDGLALKIPYRYAWETDPDDSENILEPKHLVYFYSGDIPKK